MFILYYGISKRADYLFVFNIRSSQLPLKCLASDLKKNKKNTELH